MPEEVLGNEPMKPQLCQAAGFEQLDAHLLPSAEALSSLLSLLLNAFRGSNYMAQSVSSLSWSASR